MYRTKKETMISSFQTDLFCLFQSFVTWMDTIPRSQVLSQYNGQSFYLIIFCLFFIYAYIYIFFIDQEKQGHRNEDILEEVKKLDTNGHQLFTAYQTQHLHNYYVIATITSNILVIVLEPSTVLFYSASGQTTFF